LKEKSTNNYKFKLKMLGFLVDFVVQEGWDKFSLEILAQQPGGGRAFLFGISRQISTLFLH
jgi:hypothetical protein